MSRSRFKRGDEIWDQIEKDEMGPASIAFDKNPQAMMEPQEVGAAAEVGQEGQARADHVHAGVTGVEFDDELIQGVVELLEGTNVSMVADSDDRTVTISASTGGRTTATTRITSDYSVTSTDAAIFCDTDGGGITVTLPEGDEGRVFEIANCGSSGNKVTLTPDGSELITGASSLELDDGESVTLVFEATEYWWAF